MTVTCYAFNCCRRNKHFGNCFLMFAFLIFLLFSSVLVDAAPHKSKKGKNDGPQLVFDQKQTGDYNIQLHLKNFQIIAMLGDDMLGDYDYNYDYADFTIKPSGSTSTSTTPKPPPSSPPSTTQKATAPTTSQTPSSSSEQNFVPSDLMIADVENSSNTKRPLSILVSNAHPYRLEVIVPQPTKKPDHDPQILQIKEVLTGANNEKAPYSSNDPPIEDSTSQDVTLETILNLVSSSKPLVSSAKPSYSSQSSSLLPSKPSSSPSLSLPIPSPSPESPPGKIKVEILGASIATKAGAPSEGIVPGEEVQGVASGSVLHSELASYRKCSNGYGRDKRGRCRRIRRPGLSSQLPFGLSRLASNLATRLKLTPNENPATTSISTES